jgi:hypothetical protein
MVIIKSMQDDDINQEKRFYTICDFCKKERIVTLEYHCFKDLKYISTGRLGLIKTDFSNLSKADKEKLLIIDGYCKYCDNSK